MTQPVPPVRAVLRGGPLDGQEHAMAEDADHLDVTLADDTRHRYDRASPTGDRADGRVVFEWSGRR